ncbi:unnamed protein product [Linum trigynum]|uniref:Reverse transcriptase domain-containing protein n=1 Tax=Linum trigynum TaxID=586398 RepID=A0AAV2EC39_9ROSI
MVTKEQKPLVEPLSKSSRITTSTEESLPIHLEYAFVRERSKILIIISSSLTPKKKARLVELLKKLDKALVWNITEIWGISMSLCSSKIQIKDNIRKPVQPQRRLNHHMKEALKATVNKLLDARVIYPFFNSE